MNTGNSIIPRHVPAPRYFIVAADRQGGDAGTSGITVGSNFDDTVYIDVRGHEMRGGAGSDTVDYGHAATGVRVGLADGTASGGAAGDRLVDIEHLRGSGHDDRLAGDDGSNRLHGGAGNDRLTGGAGGDHLHGGAGRDWLDYRGSETGVSINLARGTASGGDAEGDRFSGIEHLRGSGHDDWLTGDGGSNRLHGGAGDDILHGGPGAGDDTLVGGSGADVFRGRGGDDVFDISDSHAAHSLYIHIDRILDFSPGRASGGDETGAAPASGDKIRITGATIVGYRAVDRNGDGRADATILYEGVDPNGRIYGILEYFTGPLYATDFTGDVTTVRRIEGRPGMIYEVELTGGTGDDELLGSSGRDRLKGEAGRDMLYGRHGDDWLEGGAGHDTLYGGTGADLLFGDDGNDRLEGNAGDDRLYGMVGNDRLDGGAGADRLYGGGGRDVMTGGSGRDMFEVRDVSQTLGEADLITDFSGHGGEGDTIDPGASVRQVRYRRLDADGDGDTDTVLYDNAAGNGGIYAVLQDYDAPVAADDFTGAGITVTEIA